MRNRPLLATLVVLCVTSLLPSSCWGQPPDIGSDQDLPVFGLAVGVSTLGAGIQAATAVTQHSNLRGGFNYFKYSASFNKDGVAYNGTLKLQSAEILYDQYIGGVFHVSPGVVLYDGNQGAATASVPGGQSFTLGGVTYYSDSANPVSGTGSIAAKKAAPELLLGFGNLLPRSARRFTVNFEFGAVYQGPPNAKLNLYGGTCDTPGKSCQSIGSNSAIQSNIQSEQNKINSALSVFKYYPVVRLSLGYKF
jgi:hypothetical protein